jgi:glutathione peroxidase
MTDVYDFTVAQPAADPLALWDLHGDVLLLVATGRETSATPQLQGLQALSNAFAANRFTIIAFPEPPLSPRAPSVTATDLGVPFRVAAPVANDGPDVAPLFAWLSSQAPGPFGTTAVPGYTKFLIGRDGSVLRRFAPQDDAAELIAAVRLALAAPIPPPPPHPAAPPQQTAAASPQPSDPVPAPAGDLALDPPEQSLGEGLMDLSQELHELELETRLIEEQRRNQPPEPG